MEAGNILHRVTLESTALAWVCYLEQEHILQVGLCSGREYEYSDVPLATYRQLLAAQSKGKYYNAHIRNHFRYRETCYPHTARP